MFIILLIASSFAMFVFIILVESGFQSFFMVWMCPLGIFPFTTKVALIFTTKINKNTYNT
jgi:hypothetical protein